MSVYRKILPNKNALLIVIHAKNKEQVLRNSQIALEEVANGVFLINHSISFNELLF